MQSIEAEGHSIDDAIERALRELGVNRDRVEIEIVANATRGLFGLGGKRARVRATLRQPLAVGEPPPSPPAAARATPAARDPVAPAPAAAPPAAPTRAPRRERGAAPPAQRAAPRPAAPAPRRPAPAAAPPPPAIVDRAREVLVELVRLTGVEASVAVYPEDDAARLDIQGDPSGVLIGRRGQTLDAIEYLVNRIASHGEDGTGRLIVDAQGYRARRREALEAMAHRLAARARERGKPVTLNPMSPRDRRIVHLALRDAPGLTTRSAGSGHYRKLIIAPEGRRR